MNTMTFMFINITIGPGILYYLLICINYIQLNYIKPIYFIDLKLEQIENL